MCELKNCSVPLPPSYPPLPQDRPELLFWSQMTGSSLRNGWCVKSAKEECQPPGRQIWGESCLSSLTWFEMASENPFLLFVGMIQQISLHPKPPLGPGLLYPSPSLIEDLRVPLGISIAWGRKERCGQMSRFPFIPSSPFGSGHPRDKARKLELLREYNTDAIHP